MSSSGISLINLDGAGNVVIKLLDMIGDATGWVAMPHGAKKDFEDALTLYKKSIEDNSELSGIAKAAKISASRKELRQYINQGKIISYAIPDIKSDAKLDVEMDWLAYFFEYAKNISDEDVQKIWARILAEQCNGDTSVKRMLIHILSLLDTRTAMSFGKLCRITFKYPQMPVYEYLGTKFISQYIPLIINPTISSLYLTLSPEDERHKMVKEYRDCIPEPSEIAILQEIGLIELSEKRNNDFEYPYNFGLIKHDYSGKGNRYRGSEVQDYIIDYGGEKYKVVPNTVDKYDALSETGDRLPETIKFGLVKFTTAGETLFRMLIPEKISGFRAVFQMYMQSQNFMIEAID